MTPDYRFFVTGEDRDPRKTLDTLAARHGVQIVVLSKERRTKEAVHATAPEAHALSFFAPHLAACLNRYPASFFQAIGLTAIILCGSLKYQGEVAAGVAACLENTIYFTTEFEMVSDHLIHHEIYHFLDDRIYQSNLDEEWERLYQGRQRKPETETRCEQMGSTSEALAGSGFVSEYAVTNIHEDKAETFASLMTNWRRVTRLLESDPLIKQKVALIRKRLSEPPASFGDEFWRKAVEFDTGGW